MSTTRVRRTTGGASDKQAPPVVELRRLSYLLARSIVISARPRGADCRNTSSRTGVARVAQPARRLLSAAAAASAPCSTAAPVCGRLLRHLDAAPPPAAVMQRIRAVSAHPGHAPYPSCAASQGRAVRAALDSRAACCNATSCSATTCGLATFSFPSHGARPSQAEDPVHAVDRRGAQAHDGARGGP